MISSSIRQTIREEIDGYTTVDEVPDDAMPVEHGLDDSDHQNYVRHPVTDIIEWYTVRPEGEIIRERFLSLQPVDLESIGILARTEADDD